MLVRVISAFFVCASVVGGAQTLSPSNTIQALLAESHLQQADRPWHMKVTITEGNGAITEAEEWHASETRSVVAIRSKAFNQTHFTTPNGSFIEGDKEAVPPTISLLLSKIVHPGPDEYDLKDALYQQGDVNFGGVKLSCVMMAQSIPKATKLPMGLFPTYCFTPGTTNFRVAYLFGGIFLAINKSGTFLGNEVPMTLQAFGNDGKEIAKASVKSLTAETADEKLYLPSNATVQVRQTNVRLSMAVLESQILNKVPPNYPFSARMTFVQGKVVLHALVGTDGRVHALQVKESPDADLAAAAIEAVRQWTYKPYLLNGVPATVDADVQVNFEISGRR